MYDMHTLQYTKKGTYNENVPIKNSQKTSKIKNYRPQNAGGINPS